MKKKPLTPERAEDIASRIYKRIQKVYAHIVKEETLPLKVHDCRVQDLIRIYAYPVAMLAATEVLGMTKATHNRAVGDSMFRSIVLLMEEVLSQEVYKEVKDENEDSDKCSSSNQ